MNKKIIAFSSVWWSGKNYIGISAISINDVDSCVRTIQKHTQSTQYLYDRYVVLAGLAVYKSAENKPLLTGSNMPKLSRYSNFIEAENVLTTLKRGGVLTAVHFSGKQGYKEAFKYLEPFSELINAIQINDMPEDSDILSLAAKNFPRAMCIYAINNGMLSKDNIFQIISHKEMLIDGLLLDASGGKGTSLHSNTAELIKSIQKFYPNLHLVIAGGLGGNNICNILQQFNSLQNGLHVSTDAESLLRKVNPQTNQEEIDQELLGSYLNEARRALV
ncbi:MAG: hypothetical protein PHV30_02655 [Candidatus Margulisbacteria bacterium]|nr:hypothetical protein [Candidatus Margulisiibacteriota bacterium]